MGQGTIAFDMTRTAPNRKTLLMTYPEAEVTGAYARVCEALGPENALTFVACPPAPDANEYRCVPSKTTANPQGPALILT
jgi:hypothetical protein